MAGGAFPMNGAGPSVPVTEEAIRRARLFWEQSQADLKEARRLLRGKAYLESSFLSVQASLNALTGVCYLQGQFRVPNHSVQSLAGLLAGVDGAFQGLGDPAAALEEAQELNPFSADRDLADEQRRARLYYGHSDAILSTVRGYLKRNRRRFFSP